MHAIVGGGAGRQLPCVLAGGEEQGGWKVSAIRLAHWVNEYSHADRNDAKSFPIAKT